LRCGAIFPACLAAATGCQTLVYSRYGYGQSDVLVDAFTTDFMHREAREVFARTADCAGYREPVLVGHSDGASMPCCMPVTAETA